MTPSDSGYYWRVFITEEHPDIGYRGLRAIITNPATDADQAIDQALEIAGDPTPYRFTRAYAVPESEISREVMLEPVRKPMFRRTPDAVRGSAAWRPA